MVEFFRSSKVINQIIFHIAISVLVLSSMPWTYSANVNPLLIWKGWLGIVIVGSKSLPWSSSITMLLNMMHAINTFAIIMIPQLTRIGYNLPLWLQYIETIFYIFCELFLGTWINYGVIFFVVHEWSIQNMTINDRCHWQASNSEDAHCHPLWNWNQHLHPPINLESKGSYLEHSNYCCNLAI